MPGHKLSKNLMQHTAEQCIDCGKCTSRCLFLAEYGSPGKIAQEGLSSPQKHRETAVRSYDCSMCHLCSAVCPVNAGPAEMFGGLRIYAQNCNLFDLKKYSPLLAYEKTGRNFPFRDNFIPENCETAFFPGCTLPALFPKATRNAFSALRKKDKRYGLILNCCSKPSKMLGLQEKHEDSISALVDEIESKGIKRILTGCPNCHMTLQECQPPFKVQSIYEELRDLDITPVAPYLKEVTIHDPCVTRYEDKVHECIRELLNRAGVNITEMKHSRQKTICCGEGGALNFHNPGYAKLDRQKNCRSPKNRPAHGHLLRRMCKLTQPRTSYSSHP